MLDGVCMPLSDVDYVQVFDVQIIFLFICYSFDQCYVGIMDSTRRVLT